MAAASTYGYFGKLPCAGDFLRAGLSADFVRAWDGWLQSVMTTAEEALGPEAWMPAYLSAPIWRFSVSPGLCGPRGAAGIMMPSLDRVGRRFPFMVAWETDLPTLAANLAMQPVAERIEATALFMIEEGAVREALDAQLCALPRPAELCIDVSCELSCDLGSLWVAAATETPRIMGASGLPRGAGQSAALFDANAPYWTQVPLESCEL